MIRSKPMVSVCVITEGRPEFMEWVAFLFNRLDWPHKELVVVASREDRESVDLLWALVGKKGNRLITDTTLDAGERLGTKRNRCLELARGDWITWADDDDWYPASRLEETWNMMDLYDWPEGVQMLAVQTPQPVLCLANMRCMNRVKRWVWLHCWYRSELAKTIPFPELNIGEDGFWIDEFVRRAGGDEPPAVIQNYFPHQILCLQHPRNISCGGHSTEDKHWPDEMPEWLDPDALKEVGKLKERLGL